MDLVYSNSNLGRNSYQCYVNDDKKMKKKKRKSRAKTKYLISIFEPGFRVVDVCYLGYDWLLARTAIDTARANVKWRGYELRMIKSINRKVISIKKSRIV